MRTSRVWSVAAVLAVCLGTKALAQDSPQQTSSVEQAAPQPAPPPSAPSVLLDKISITATKSEGRSVFDIPGHVSVIDRQDIERYQAQDLADLLRYEPGINIVSGPRRITERPSIRGLSGTRVLLTVDGARLNYNTAHGGNLNFVDIESLERLEIIRGPASALYGSSALGGTINMLTKSGSEMLRPGQTVGARARWTFNSNNQELSEHVSVYGLIHKRFDYILSYTRHDASDVETARDKIDNSGFRTNDVFLKGRYFLTGRDTLTFTTQLFRDTSDIPFASSDQDASRTQDDDTDRNLFNLRYDHHSPGSWLSRITWLGYLHQTDIQEDEKRRSSDHSRTTIKDDLDWDTWGSEIRGSTPFSLLHQAHLLTYGFEYFRDEFEQRQHTNTFGVNEAGLLDLISSRETTQFPDAHSDNYGFYLQDEITILDRLVIIAGVRYDKYRLRASTTDAFLGSLEKDTRSADQWSPKIGGVLYITDKIRLTGNIARGFRTPTFRELFIAGPHFFGVDFATNPNLKPEKSLNYEAGWHLNFPRWHLSAHYFRNKLKDFIDFQQRSALYWYQYQAKNVSKATIWGVETKAGWTPPVLDDSLYVFAHYTYTRGTDRTADEPLNSISPQQGLIGIRYTPRRRPFWVEWSAKIVDDQDRVRPPARSYLPDPRSTGYAVFDIRASWRLRAKLRLHVAIENLLDRYYRRHLSSLGAEGINLAVGLTYDW